jgi:hypothetical protein
MLLAAMSSNGDDTSGGLILPTFAVARKQGEHGHDSRRAEVEPGEALMPRRCGCAKRAAPSALVRAAHQLQGCFDMSPGLGFFRLTLFLVTAGFLSGLDDSFIAVSL